MENSLFRPLRDGYVALAAEPGKVRDTIRATPSFAMYSDRVDKAMDAWARELAPEFASLDAGTDVKRFIASPAAVLMERFSSLTLFDPYDVYEVLLKYWTDSMNDDVHLVVADGWEAGREIETFYRETENKRTKQIKKVETGWDGLLIPRNLLDARFFKAEAERVAKAEADLETAKAELEELAEDLAASDEAQNGEAVFCAPMLAAEKRRKAAAKALKAALKQLEAKERAKYPALTMGEIKELVVADKWIAAVRHGIAELSRSISSTLTERVVTLAERYGRSLGEIEADYASLQQRISAKIATLGYGNDLPHELLTGRKRLPGFNEPWVAVSLGAIGFWQKGQPLSKADITINGETECIHYGELFTKYGPVISST